MEEFLKEFLPIMSARLQAILTFKKFKAYIMAEPNNKRMADLPIKKYKDYVLFTEKAEKKFFKLKTINIIEGY